MTVRSSTPVVGQLLDPQQVRRGGLVARWRIQRRSGERIEVLATVIRTGRDRERLVVAKRTRSGGWAATHVLSADDDRALRMLRRQGLA